MPIALRPEPEARRLVVLPYGHLPVTSYFVMHSQLPAATARELLTVMRATLRKLGPTPLMRATLRAVGFDWTTPTADLSMLEDVDAVDAALAVQPYKSCTRCGTVYSDRAAWERLPLCGSGYQPQFDDNGDQRTDVRLELRNCPCHSTLSVEVPCESTADGLEDRPCLDCDCLPCDPGCPSRLADAVEGW
jgi:hypothetical protein